MLGLRLSRRSRYYFLWLRIDNIAFMSHLISSIYSCAPIMLVPSAISATTHAPHLLLKPCIFLFFSMSLIFSLVKEGSTHFLLAFLYLFKQVKLAHLLHQLLILFLLLCDLLLLKFLLSLLLLQVSLSFFMLFHLLNEETTLEAPRSAVLTSTVLDEEATK